jgi:hypothetical protein
VDHPRVVSGKVSPTCDELTRLAAQVPDGPIVVVNLLKFKPGGTLAYRRYLQAAYKAFDPKAGPQPTPLYTGMAGPDLAGGENWDFVIIARWSSAAHFVHQLTTERYTSEAVPLRVAALERALLMVTIPAEPSAIWA